MAKTVLMTGCSSGIGYVSAEYFAERKWNVVATMRKPSSTAGRKLSALPNVEVLPLDVTDMNAIQSTVQAAVAKFGSLDVLVNNAGYGLCGPIEFASAEQVQKQYATNLFGPLHLMQAVIPQMRKQGGGIIVNVSSIGGKIVLPFCSLYQSTKFAMEGLSECAALELAPFGIRVRTVQPGFVKTEIGNSMVVTSSETVKVYDRMIANAFKGFDDDFASGSPVIRSAEVIFEAATDQSSRLRFAAGEEAEVLLKRRTSMSDEEHQKYINDRYKLVE